MKKHLYFLVLPILCLMLFSTCRNKQTKQNVEASDFAGTEWRYVSKIDLGTITCVLKFIDEENYLFTSAISGDEINRDDSNEGKYEVTTAESGKKVINTETGQYEIKGKKLISYTEDGISVYRKVE